MPAVPTEARRGRQIPWSLSYRARAVPALNGLLSISPAQAISWIQEQRRVTRGGAGRFASLAEELVALSVVEDLA